MCLLALWERTVAIISMFVPLAGSWLTIVAGLLAAFAYGPGIGLAIASIVINFVHIIFFSPLLWVSSGLYEAGIAFGEEISKSQGRNVDIETVFLPWILLSAQIGFVILLFMLHKKRKTQLLFNLYESGSYHFGQELVENQ